MRHRIDLALVVAAFIAVFQVWVPVLPWPIALPLVLGVWALLPGRTLVHERAQSAPAAALSALLVTATTWALVPLLGGLAPAARAAFTLWVLLGTFVFLRRTAGAPVGRPSWAASLMLVILLVAAAFPAVVDPALLTRTEARLFFPLLGEMQGGTLPPSNPFLVGTPSGAPWVFAALAAPFRHLTGAPAPALLLGFQLAGLILLVTAAWRWAALRGGNRWSRILLPALLAGGLTLFGFRNLPGLADLEDPSLAGAPLLRALAGLAGDPAAAGLLSRVWGASGLIWSLGCVAAAGALAEGRRFAWRAPITGALLGAAVLLHPAVGVAGAVMWIVLRLAEATSGPRNGESRFGETLLAAAVALALGLPYLLTLHAPFAELPLTLGAAPDSHRWAALVETIPLFLVAAAGLAARRDRRGWIAALGAGAIWGLAAPFSPAALLAFLWASLLFAGIPAALGLDRLGRRAWGGPVLAAVAALFLVTPLALAWQARTDRSGETRWTPVERAMFARADRALPADAVLLTLPTTRSTSEELVMLPRAAYLGTRDCAEVMGLPGDTTAVRVAEERGRRVSDFIRGRNPVALLDRMAAEMAPHPLALVVSSEDAARHPDLVENIYSTAMRFRPLENTETLKILLYAGPAGEGSSAVPGGAPPKPRIILRPGEGGAMIADTIGTIVDTLGAAADSGGVGPGSPADTTDAGTDGP